MQNKCMRILGIDPGTNRVGYGLIEASKNNLGAVEYGVLEIPPYTDRHERIIKLASEFRKLLKRLSPEYVGMETLFFGKNRKTALAVSEARGILLLLALERNLPVIEHKPQTVKLAVTSYGLSDKQAVAKMTAKILHLPEIRNYDDASDALAVAIATAGNLLGGNETK